VEGWFFAEVILAGQQKYPFILVRNFQHDKYCNGVSASFPFAEPHLVVVSFTLGSHASPNKSNKTPRGLLNQFVEILHHPPISNIKRLWLPLMLSSARLSMINQTFSKD
jgi:hypothetical protein